MNSIRIIVYVAIALSSPRRARLDVRWLDKERGAGRMRSEQELGKTAANHRGNREACQHETFAL